MFDTLVKLTYNMQVYISALKVATTLNHKPIMTSVSISKENNTVVDNFSCHVETNLDEDISNITPPSLSMMDISECDTNTMTEEQQQLTPFSKAIAFVNSIVYLTQNETDMIIKNEDEFSMTHHDCEVIVNNNQINVSLDALQCGNETKEGMLLLEKYGRQCTLPFLRFAALLKKYINENDNIEDHDNVLTTSLLLQQQSNLGMEHSPTHQVDKTNHVSNSTKCSSSHCHCHWSKDDSEFLMLARYLNLLNNDDKEKKCMQDEKCCDGCNNGINNSLREMKPCDATQLQPPSAMEAVIWPESYSMSVDNVDTPISRTWLMSFRESLTAQRPIFIDGNVINPDNTYTHFADVPSTSSGEVKQSMAISTSNILISARLLLSVDCCDGRRAISDNSNILPISDRNVLPTVHWTGPHLLRLPHLYDDVFQFYHGRPCFRCHSIPRETSVCLMCGVVVCLKENCCKTSGTYEAVQVRIVYIVCVCVCIYLFIYLFITTDL